MAIELLAQRSLSETLDGLQARQVWQCTIADWANNLFDGPQIGDAWGGTGWGWLRCVSRNTREVGPYDMEVECQFNTRPQGDEAVRETFGFGVEVLDTTRTTKWEDAGSVCDVPVSTIYPIIEYGIIYRQALSNPNVQLAIGKINDRIFRGFPTDTMLFEGAELTRGYNAAGELLDSEISYRFLIRQRSHNEVWREARQLLIKGIPQYWQAQDPTAPYYTAEGVGDPKEGDPKMTNGVPGTAGWDKPKDAITDKYRYETCDFAFTLGIPKLLGDD